MRWRGPGGRAAGLALAGLLVVGAPGFSFIPGEAGRTELPRAAELTSPLPYEKSVKDPIFAVLVALMETERYGVLRRPTLESEVRRRGTSSRLPYQKVDVVSREALGPASGRLSVEFAGPLRTSIPYSILGYHPGSIQTSAVCRFREWRLGDVALGSPPVDVRDVHLFALEQGNVRVDIAAWLDALLAGALDDMNMTGFVFFNYKGRRTAVGFGYNDDARGLVGAFDFTDDDLLFPASRELRFVGQRLRTCSETLLKTAGPDEAAAPLAARCAGSLR